MTAIGTRQARQLWAEAAGVEGGAGRGGCGCGRGPLMSQDWTALLFQHAAAFLRRVCIISGAATAVTKNYDLVIVTAGARQIPGENRLNLLQTNAPLYRKIAPSLAELSLEALLLVVSNPVDVLTYIAWRLSSFPASRVIGCGTNLDSYRFRFLIDKHLDVNPQDVRLLLETFDVLVIYQCEDQRYVLCNGLVVRSHV
ncbi:L-lactate dehydrogenase B-like [Triticum dicoccoides]|uniref:L-lactate dehydrogenase B-like n=1 Tax=Triticum dicoccoides TaxID=85692 RepID=UPI00188EC938|nr:L-lactate dehydrogenase B-like [Triticum dicoccoides]